MNNNYILKGIIKFISGALMTALLLFIPAGSLNYCQAWLFLGILFIPMAFLGIYMFIKMPELLKKRLNPKENQKKQTLLIKLSGIMFLIGFIVAGLDYRFKISILPDAVSYLFAFIFLIGYALYIVVLKQNEYLSRTVEVQQNQKVVDTGLYGIVRHPMYSATIIMFLAIPLVLGSLIAFVIFLVYPAIIVSRLKLEEALLEKELEGYIAYKSKVKYRLIPFVW
ncbi:MAG: isoprenylcysteine carboxylmethyltransferase family protein [Christensenellaceae bacterium]|nr:isoprenylcysteine carboxylmethyltransferase family protein [Christensenellaceae bacterium]